MEHNEVQRRERWAGVGTAGVGTAGVGTAGVRAGKGRAVLQIKRERGVRRQTDTRSSRTVLHVIFRRLLPARTR